MLSYIEHHIVNHCNLNCSGCSHFSPLAEQWFETKEDFYKDFTQLSKITEKQIGWLRIMGGEPLLHPNVDDFLIKCRELFPYSKLSIVTNGLLLKKKGQNFVDLCNNNKIVLDISDYGILNIDEVLKNFKYTGIAEKSSTMYNPCIDLKGTQNIVESFLYCDLHVNHNYFFQNGRIYPCCVMGNINIFNKYFNTNIYTSEDDISISIYNHTQQEILQFINHPRESCKYCNTKMRSKTLHQFSISKKDIKEWTYEMD